GDLFPYRLVRRERVAGLVDVSECDRLAETQGPAVWCFLAVDHSKQRRLSGAVRANHADDATARQGKADIVHQEQVAVAFSQATGLDDDVAKPRTRRDVDLDLLDLLCRFFLEQILVGVQSGLALGLA